ncbi:MAG: ferrous iron transport protein A [Candidatus Coproplasma sp.]
MGVFNLKKGQSGVVKLVAVDGTAGQRLTSLGVVKGALITVIGYCLFNSSVLILCGYNRIALRKSVAQRIEVEQC